MLDRSLPGTPAESTSEERVVGADRVLAVLTLLAGYPHGIGLDELATTMGSAKPTVHRALASLRKAGLADQDGRGRYLLGDEFLRMAFAHHEARPDHVRVQPILEALAAKYAETVHYAVLDGRSVVYRSKIDPPVGAVRLTSVIGGRNPAHCTAVGKMLLAYQLPDDHAVGDWIDQAPLERPTPRTKVTAGELAADLELARQRGYSIEEEENEKGISCLALPVYLNSPTRPSGAISISCLNYRTDIRTVIDDLDAIRATITGGTAD